MKPTQMEVAIHMKVPTTKVEATKKKAASRKLENGVKVVPQVKS